MRMGDFRRLVIAPLLAVVVTVTPAWAQVAIPGFELVRTVPVATDIPSDGIRDTVSVWCDMIDGARYAIDFEQYYAASKPGEPLERVIAHMEAAARRGVRIRFLMEKKGLAASDPATLDRLKAIPGIDFRLLDYSSVTGDGIIHAKFFIVDGREAFVGSQNFDWRSLKHIDETGLRISNPTTVSQLTAIFSQDWAAQIAIAEGRAAPKSAQSGTHHAVDVGNYLVASPAAYNPAGVRDSEDELVDLLASARHEVRIEVMDYAPLDQHRAYYGPIDQALRAAAQRGVQVKLLVADWNLSRAKLPYLKSLAILPNVAVRYVTIPPSPEGVIPFARVLHTKTMEIDDHIAWIGTSNWEGGYLDKSRNVEIVLHNDEMAKRLDVLHEQLWSSAYAHPIEACGNYAPPNAAGK